ncbi:MAG: hypothetical protein QMD53_01675 [Actinomycetota bacterium]|nr:hypothetical protein [Actinomycetota bacterium]
MKKGTSVTLLTISIGWLTWTIYSLSGPGLVLMVSSALYGTYFIFILMRGAEDALWSAISLPFGYVFFFKGAGASLIVMVALSIIFAALTLILLPWVLYRG